MPIYIGIIHKEPESDYGVSFPDFPGCVTAGKTLAEAERLAQEALQFHIDGMREDGDALPLARSLDHVIATDVTIPATVIVVETN